MSLDSLENWKLFILLHLHHVSVALYYRAFTVTDFLYGNGTMVVIISLIGVVI
jgi:hypothetical protein